jgi:hypothetical protein
MNWFVQISIATAIAALSYEVCGYFSNAAMGVTTGFSEGELKLIPCIVFVIAYSGLSKFKPKNGRDK